MTRVTGWSSTHQEVGQRDSKTERPLKWKCTAECKLPASNKAQCIIAVKALFEEPVHKLREALNHIDECTEHGHYTRMLSINTPKPYYELAGHPLPCATVNSNCKSSLRILRAAATHFPLLRRLVVLLYEAIRLHRLLDNIDTGLCAGDFKKLVQTCDIEDYKVLFSASSISADAVSVDAVADDTDLPIVLQQPNLPDLESELHVQYAAIISEVEKKFSDDAEFPCCSCERLLLRKQVTAFKFTYACTMYMYIVYMQVLNGCLAASNRQNWCPAASVYIYMYLQVCTVQLCAHT